MMHSTNKRVCGQLDFRSCLPFKLNMIYRHLDTRIFHVIQLSRGSP